MKLVVQALVFLAAARPDFVGLEHAGTYVGPGREESVPSGLTELRIGYFGPSDADDPLGGDPWLAATLAVEEANREGGIAGLPVRLVPAWSTSPWGAGVRDLTRRVYEDDVWAIFTAGDGTSAHLAEQVVAKARLPLVSATCTDTTVNLANVPWIFSALPGDDVLSGELLDALANSPFVWITADDHDSRAAATDFSRELTAHGTGPRLRLTLRAGRADGLDELVDRVRTSGVEAVVLHAGAEDGARVVGRFGDRGVRVRIFAGASLARRVFVERAGAAAEGVTLALPCEPASLEGPFARAFEERFGRAPDCATLETYDAMRLLVAAVRRAGPNRARIGDALRALTPWEGVAGAVDWDALGRNRRGAHLGTVRAGRLTGL